MKTIKHSVLAFTLLFSSILFAQLRQSKAINYQGVALNSEGEPMANQDIDINIKLRFGAFDAAVVYEENHNAIPTDASGVFSLMIGRGRDLDTPYKAVNWNTGYAPFATISLNGMEVGTVELRAVPYALSAGSAETVTGTFSRYFELGSLNTNSITAVSTFKPIGPELVFNKTHKYSRIEVFFNSRCSVGNFTGGASLVRFQIRVDGMDYNYGNDAAIGTEITADFLSTFSVFRSLDAGEHSIQVYARTNAGFADAVYVDPGGLGGKIVAKETF